jgi:hypothetical protein
VGWWTVTVASTGAGPLLHPGNVKVAQATDGLSFGLGFGQSGKQQAGHDGDDANDHQQFDQRKASPRLKPAPGHPMHAAHISRIIPPQPAFLSAFRVIEVPL